MKIIASIVFSLVVAIFAVKANKERFRELNNQVMIDQARERGENYADEIIAEVEVDRLTGRISLDEQLVRIADSDGERVLALENLRESRAELRRYQSQLAR